jgi:hypothetical protein
MAVICLCHCSSDLAYDFFVIQGKKLQLWGHCFQDIPDIHEQLLTALLVIPKVVLPAMVEAPDLLCKVRRGLLWREKQYLITHLSIYFVTDFQNLGYAFVHWKFAFIYNSFLMSNIPFISYRNDLYQLYYWQQQFLKGLSLGLFSFELFHLRFKAYCMFKFLIM